MPNWCHTSYAFYGDINQLTAFHQKIEESLHAPHKVPNEEYGDNWLGYAVQAFGFTKDTFDCRGTFESIEPSQISEGVLYIDITGAWGSLSHIWRAIIPKFYPDVKFVYAAEEPDDELYVNSDIDKLYFDDEYALQCYLPDSKAFGSFGDQENFSGRYGSEEELLDECNDVFGMEFSSIDELSAYMDKAIEESDDDDDDYYFEIHKFTSPDLE